MSLNCWCVSGRSAQVRRSSQIVFPIRLNWPVGPMLTNSS